MRPVIHFRETTFVNADDLGDSLLGRYHYYLMHPLSLPEVVKTWQSKDAPLSRKNLAQDLQVDLKTIEKWITILENVYYCYRIWPYGPPKIKAVKKEQKIYFWDWSELEDVRARWERPQKHGR